MQFEYRIGVICGQFCYANFSNCAFDLIPGPVGHRLQITLYLASTGAHTDPLAEREPVVDRIEGDIFLVCGTPDSHRLLGSLTPWFRNSAISLKHDSQYTVALDMSDRQILQLADMTRGGDATFLVELAPRLSWNPLSTNIASSRVRIPESQWLNLLAKSGLCRFEFVTLRTPPRDSAAFPVYDECLNLLNQAQQACDRGDWNTVGSRCRAGLRHLISWANPRTGTDAFDKLLANLTGDPRRKKFARALLKGLNDILNEATHLEGDATIPPAELRREDALLCLHWYATIIGYIADVEKGVTVMGGSAAGGPRP